VAEQGEQGRGAALKPPGLQEGGWGGQFSHPCLLAPGKLQPPAVCTARST